MSELRPIFRPSFELIVRLITALPNLLNINKLGYVQSNYLLCFGQSSLALVNELNLGLFSIRSMKRPLKCAFQFRKSGSLSIYVEISSNSLFILF